jgi:alkanesulfonate monooxygenase SsuD/methylene tetrahydromethanopterin reductase-like flavin-dependent oxidoreductase (luciferase family)
MVGANGPRMLRITLPHVDAWNTWYDEYGNTAEGFAAMNEDVSSVAREVGRPTEEIERSACVFVALDRSADERPITPEAPPVEGTPEQIAARLRELADAGADEAILVVTPITERSVRELAEVVASV